MTKRQRSQGRSQRADEASSLARLVDDVSLAGRALTVALGVLAAVGRSNGPFFRVLGVVVAAMVSSLEVVGKARTRRVLTAAVATSVIALVLGVAVGAPRAQRPIITTDLAIGLLRLGGDGTAVGAERLRSSLLGSAAAPPPTLSAGGLSVSLHPVDSTGPDDRSAAGLTVLSEQSGVSALLGGAVTLDDRGRSIGTFFVYFASDAIRDAPEVATDLPLRPIRVDGDIARGGEPLRQMRAHIEAALRQVTLMLDGAEQTRARRYDVAAQRFDAALRIGADPPVSADVLHVLLGNTYLARTTGRRTPADLQAARAAFEDVDANGDEAGRRAVGLAEIEYLTAAADGCRQGIDTSALDRVVDQLGSVVKTVGRRPTDARTSGKAAIGVVRARVCQNLSGNRVDLPAAMASLSTWLTKAGTEVEPDLRSAARAWHAIGLRTVGQPGATDEMHLALSMASDPASAGRWWLILGDWQRTDCDLPAALASVERAQSEFALSPDDGLRTEGAAAVERARRALADHRCG